MPAESPGPATRPILNQRRSERRDCDMAATIRTGGGEFPARLLNLSEGGFGARIDTLLALRPGAPLTLIHPSLGEVACRLQWAAHPRYGAAFHAGPQASARIQALYDSLPPAPGEIA